MRMAREMMIKQRIGEIPETDGHPRLEIFESGDPQYVVVAPMQKVSHNLHVSGALHIPVKKSNMKRGWRKDIV
jgi:hypothetical protein